MSGNGCLTGEKVVAVTMALFQLDLKTCFLQGPYAFGVSGIVAVIMSIARACIYMVR